MKQLILTDLTRFSKTPEKVCIALIDPSDGVCYRPMPYLSTAYCEKTGLKPGAKFTGIITVKPMANKPHIEDSNYSNLRYIGDASEVEFQSVLENSISSGVANGFGVSFEPHQRHIPSETQAVKSIITVKVNPAKIKICKDQYDPNKIKISFTDSEGHYFDYLSITDKVFWDFWLKHQQPEDLDNMNSLISTQNDVYLRIGLSREYKAENGKIGCWLQANGIYTFPKNIHQNQ